VEWPIITMHPGIGSDARVKDWAFCLARLKTRPTRMAVMNSDSGVGAPYIAALIHRKD
jgi:hypothetical protein